MDIKFDNDYMKKVMIQTFGPGQQLASAKDFARWRATWLQALASWHSPYKCLVVIPADTTLDTDIIAAKLPPLAKFFKGFFMRKLVILSASDQWPDDLEGAEVIADHSAAMAAIGQKGPLPNAAAKTLRQKLTLANDFQNQVVELAASEPVVLETVKDINILKAKLTNNLMQWHSPWNLVVDMANLQFAAGLSDEMAKLIKYLSGFFLKNAVGYGIKVDLSSVPFKIYRSRHKALTHIESEGHGSSDVADCASRKPGLDPDSPVS